MKKIISVLMEDDGSKYYVDLLYPSGEHADLRVIEAETVLDALDGITLYIENLSKAVEEKYKTNITH